MKESLNIHAVAERAGVSAATVSRAFNYPDKVAPATRAAIASATRELGYQPNASARTLRTQRSRVLGVVLPTLLNPVFAECLQGVASAAASAGYSIAPMMTGYDDSQEQHAVAQLLAASVDAMILVVSNPGNSPALKQLQAARLPYALAYNVHCAHPCVSVDSEAAAAAAVAHLISLGHKRISMVSGTLAASDRAQQRVRGYVRAMTEAGLTAQTPIEVPFVTTAVDVICEHLRTPERPSALFCSNDLLAVRSMRAAQLAGLSVPQDLSVVGFDGIAIGQDLTPSLSTIAQPNVDIGRRSVELLLHAIALKRPVQASDSLLLPYAFHEGESCCAAPGFCPH